MADGIVVNVGAGTTDVRPLTLEEQATITQIQADAATAQAAEAAVLAPEVAAFADLASTYTAMLTRAQTIQTQMVGTPTNAQVRDAVKDLALGMERVLKALRALARRQGATFS